MPLVRRLVDMHQGTFEIESEVGKGTIATVAQPAHRLIAAAPAEERLTA